MPLKVVLDTDIGTDVDDLYALAFILASPEFDLRGVTIVQGDVTLRAKIALKLLDAAGRTDIPVALGMRDPMQYGVDAFWRGNEGHGLDLDDVKTDRIYPLSASALMLDVLRKHPSQVTAVTIGPVTNLGVMARDHPDALSGFREISTMGGNFQGLNARSITPEHNFRCDPEAAESVTRIHVPKRFVGLNVTRQTALTRDHLAALAKMNTPVARLLADAGTHYMDLHDRQKTPMHDSLAAAVLIDPKICRWQNLSPRVQTLGNEAGVVTFREKPHEGVPLAQIAVDINLESFQNLFWDRISSFASGK